MTGLATSSPGSSSRSRSSVEGIDQKSLGFTHDVFEPNGDNRDRMDSVRDEVWPLLGLTPPAHGALAGPTPGGGYYPEMGPWPARSSGSARRPRGPPTSGSRSTAYQLPRNE